MPLKDWSVVANDNNKSPPNGFPESMTIANLNNSARQLMADVRTLAAEDTIASATTCDLGTKDATFLTISGTTTITGFGTVSAGIYKFVRFSGALTLTHNATSLILLTGANRTTVAGDCGLYKSEGSGNWREYFYSGQNAYQPLDADLTSIAALTTTAYGRALLELSNAAAARTTLELATVTQAEAEAGTATTTRAWTAERVKQSVAALAPSPAAEVKAWINFNGTSASIGTGRASYNVVSVTDNGTGDYTINFINAISDANYSVVLGAQGNTSVANNPYLSVYPAASGGYTPTTTSVRVRGIDGANAIRDLEMCCVTIIR